MTIKHTKLTCVEEGSDEDAETTFTDMEEVLVCPYPVTVKFESSYDACFYGDFLEIISRFVVAYGAGIAGMVCVSVAEDTQSHFDVAKLACHSLVADCSSMIFVLVGFMLAYMHDRIDFGSQRRAIMVSIWIDVQVAGLGACFNVMVVLLTVQTNTLFAWSNVLSTLLQSVFVIDAVSIPAWSSANKTSMAAMATLQALLLFPTAQSLWSRMSRWSALLTRSIVLAGIACRLALSVVFFFHLPVFQNLCHTLATPTLEILIGVLLFFERDFFQISSTRLDKTRVTEAGDLLCYLSMLFCMGAWIQDASEPCFQWTVFTHCVRRDVILLPRGFLYAVLLCAVLAPSVDAGPITDDENAMKVDAAINNCEVSVARFLSIFTVLSFLWPFLTFTSILFYFMIPHDVFPALAFLMCGGIAPILFLSFLKVYFTIKPKLFDVVNPKVEMLLRERLRTIYGLPR